MTPKTGLSQSRQSRRRFLNIPYRGKGGGKLCSPSLAQELGVQRYQFLKLDVFDAQIVDQVCKDTLNKMSMPHRYRLEVGTNSIRLNRVPSC